MLVTPDAFSTLYLQLSFISFFPLKKSVDNIVALSSVVFETVVFMSDFHVTVTFLSQFISSLVEKVPEISHQKVPEEEQPARLAACCSKHQGELRTALLPDQPGRGGGRG